MSQYLLTMIKINERSKIMSNSKRMPSTFYWLWNSVTAVLILVLISATAFAQNETGQIVGRVTDPNGAVVPGATATVKSVATGREVNATSNSEGIYTVTNLQPGLYDITTKGGSFKQLTQRVQVTVGAKLSIETQLSLSDVTGSVDVVAGNGVEVNTQDQQLSNVVSQKDILELPTVTRNPYDLVGLSGNVSTDGSNKVEQPAGISVTSRGAGYVINGQRASSTNILLDGGANVDTYVAAVGQQVPLDAVGEFRVVTGNFSAEYGRATGGIVNVSTRSGSNEFHGSLYEFNRNSRFASNSFNNNASGIPRGAFNRNQFGYSVGGPILKNKLFFFSSTEWTRVRSNSLSINYVPTPQLLAASSPNTRAFFNAFPLAVPISGQVLSVGQVAAALGLPSSGNAFTALPSSLPAFGQVQYSIPQDVGGGNPQDTYSTVGRIDWNISDKTQLYGRFAVESRKYFPGFVSFSPYAGFNTGQNSFNQNHIVSLTHAFSPNLVSVTKMTFSRLVNDLPLNGAPSPILYWLPTSAPTLQGFNLAAPGYVPFTPGSGIPSGGPQNVGQFSEDLTYLWGNHSLRFGGNIVYIQDNHTFGAFENASQTLGNNIATSLNNFVVGRLFQLQIAIDPRGRFPGDSVTLPITQPSFSRSNRYNEWALYINDSFRLNPRLTLNAGVRYEYYGVQHNNNQNLDSNFYFGSGSNVFEQIRNGFVTTAPNSPIGKLWNKDKNNFAPRVGFAWDIFGDGKTSLRGGYGLGYERNFGNVTYNVIQNPPNQLIVSLTTPRDAPVLNISTSNLNFLTGNSGSITLQPASLRFVDNNIVNAFAHFWSASFEREITRNTLVSLEYSGSAGRDLYSIENLNRLGAGLRFLGSTVARPPAIGGTTSRLNGQYTNINARSNKGYSNYNGLTAGIASNNFKNHGLTFTARYTYSVAKDNLSTTFSESPGNLNLGLTDPFDPSYDYGYADFDGRHRFVGSYTWELPFAKNTKGFAKQVLNGWTVTGIFNARTGFPFTVYDCTNAITTCNRIVPVDAAGNPVQINFSGSGNPSPITSGPLAAPNIFSFINLSTIAAGTFVDPFSGGSEVGPFPTNSPARNAFRMPGYWNFDLGLYKNFQINERVRLQVRSEFFNLFNHSNLYANLNSNDLSSNGGFITAQRGVNSTLSPGVAPGAREERRNVQFALKLIF